MRQIGLTDAESMAACLYAEAMGIRWAEAAMRVCSDPTLSVYLRMGQMAVDHIGYLPSRVAQRKAHVRHPPYQWLGAEAEKAIA